MYYLKSIDCAKVTLHAKVLVRVKVSLRAEVSLHAKVSLCAKVSLRAKVTPVQKCHCAILTPTCLKHVCFRIYTFFSTYD